MVQGFSSVACHLDQYYSLIACSDVLKFEFLTQLLLDSNYLPLILKLFAHQEPDKVVDSVIDRNELG